MRPLRPPRPGPLPAPRPSLQRCATLPRTLCPSLRLHLYLDLYAGGFGSSANLVLGELPTGGELEERPSSGGTLSRGGSTRSVRLPPRHPSGVPRRHSPRLDPLEMKETPAESTTPRPPPPQNTQASAPAER